MLAEMRNETGAFANPGPRTESFMWLEPFLTDRQ